MTYTTLSPFTRFVDACLPESMAAREFAARAARVVADREAGAASALRASLLEWRDNGAALAPVLRDSPALREVAPLSEALTLAATTGLRALELVLAGGTTDTAWAEKALAGLSDAKKPMAHAELAIVPAVEALVKAAARL